MLAAPQAFFSCFTNGTSSQTPAGSAAKSAVVTHSSSTRGLCSRSSMRASANRDNDQDERRDGDEQNNQVAIAECTGSKIRLRLLHPRSQARQFSVAEAGNCILHLFRVRMRRLQRPLCTF